MLSSYARWLDALRASDPEVIRHYAGDPEPVLRQAVCRNGFTPVDILRRLAEDENTTVRLMARQRL